MNILEDGIEFRHDFFTSEELSLVRAETDFLFSKSTNAGPGFGVHLSPYVQELTWPTSKIRSINLAAKAVEIIQILDRLPEMAARRFHLAHVALYRERGNPMPLHWHSDGRGGNLVRAQVCIRGGMETSGSFQFVRTSHRLADIDYLPPDGWVDRHASLIQTCREPNGTLYIFNTLGYHNKTVCKDERVSIMFDFLPESYLREDHGDIVSDLVLSINDLTPMVLEFLPRLQIKLNATRPSPNTADAYRFALPWGGLRRRIGLGRRLHTALRGLRASGA